MGKRGIWFFIAFCAVLAALMLVVVPSPHAPIPSLDVADAPAESSAAKVGFDPVFARANDVVSATQSRAPATEASPSATPSPAPPKPVTTPVPSRPEKLKQPIVIPDQHTKPQAEVWSYPPLLQQNAMTNYIRAQGRLLAADSEIDRYWALVDVAKAHFLFGEIDEARAYATELLALDEKLKGEIWRNGQAVHDGNLVLGRIAALEGRIEEAKQFLLAAGASTGSPVLGSFGPNMSLARNLLQQGERDTVLKYFGLCGEFWKSGEKRLERWSNEVKAGRMPDFGANLLY